VKTNQKNATQHGGGCGLGRLQAGHVVQSRTDTSYTGNFRNQRLGQLFVFVLPCHWHYKILLPYVPLVLRVSNDLHPFADRDNTALLHFTALLRAATPRITVKNVLRVSLEGHSQLAICVSPRRSSFIRKEMGNCRTNARSKICNFTTYRQNWFKPGSSHVGFVIFVVDKVALRQVFSEYFGFPCQSSFHHHLSSGLVQ
jgi:hypothetical protein